VSIDDQRDLYERLDRAVEAITPPAAPVDGVMRRGKVIRWRRRSVAVAGVAAVVAAGAIAVPSLRHAASQDPATSRYTVTVQSPGPHSPAGLMASGTVNGQRWKLTAGQPGAGGAGRGQQFVGASGPAFGPDGAFDSGPAFTAPRTDPVSFTGVSSGSSQAAYGAVAADVSYVTVRLGNGIVLTLHPARVYGVRVVAFAFPLGASAVSATAYSARGEIATAIPFNAPGSIATFATWLRPGQHGLARASGPVGSGSYLGGTWSAAAYLGPWGACLTGHASGTGGSSCIDDVTDASGLGTGVYFWTSGVPAIALGSADQSVVRVVVTSPDGKTMQVRPVAVGGGKFFAFPFGKGPKPWKWTAYDGSGHSVASGKVTPLA
jgi:hypothetical protein